MEQRKNAGWQQGKGRGRGRRRKSRARRFMGKLLALLVTALFCGGLWKGIQWLDDWGDRVCREQESARERGRQPGDENASPGEENASSGEDIEGQLKELVEKNPETRAFVEGYEDRERYLGQEISLEEDFVSGQVPLLMQWDLRWGYEPLGESIIGLAGCGPTCLSMAYVYLTEDLEGNPREMARFCQEEGYYLKEGTSWELWTAGVSRLGLSGEELPLDEGRMKGALGEGKLIVCSMRPGDFTTTGHYILIRGWDENGFYVNDPNHAGNSARQWTYETLKGQIKNLWSLGR